MLPEFHTANQINRTFAADKMMTQIRTYSPEEISVRYTRYAETCSFTDHEHYTELKIINMKAANKREQTHACSFFVGGLAGLAGGAAGGATAAAVGVGGFLGGAASGAAAGAASCFITGTGNALIAGNDLATSLKCGLMGGAIGALGGALMGGVSRGIMDACQGYNFWDGSRIEEFFVRRGIYVQDFKKLGVMYDNSTVADNNDRYLKYRINELFGIKECDFEIDMITTRTDGYGLTPSGLYVNKNGDLVGGYVRSFTAGSSDLHISPYYTNAADIPFMAVTGHEITHSYHRFILKEAYRNIYSEMVAYRYTYYKYLNNGYYKAAVKTFNIANRNFYWGYFYPSNYNIPSPYLFY